MISTKKVREAMAKHGEREGRAIMWSISNDMKELVRWIEIDFQVDRQEAKRAALRVVKSLFPTEKTK